MKKNRRLFGILFLICYLVTLSQIRLFCRVGMIRSRLPLLLLGTVGAVVCFVLWLLSEKTRRNLLFWLEWTVLVGGTLYFGAGIVYSAIPYNGALAWQIEEWMNQKKVTLEHDNFLESGVEGILTDLDKALELPEELYISDKFQVSFDRNGEIQSLDTMLYGKGKDGKKRSYLADYDRQRGDSMIVWIDREEQGECEEDMRLAPMLELLEKAPWRDQQKVWEDAYGDVVYEMLYCGRRSFASGDGLQYVEGDVDGDGKEEGSSNFSLLLGGGEFLGFELSFHIPEEEYVTPVRYMMEPEYIPQAALDQKRQEEQVQEAQKAEMWTIDQADGTMYYFLDEKLGWALEVADAAAGSRFYILKRTTDGGNTWEVCSQDPFLGDIGSSQGLWFMDENLGFAGLSGASQSHATIYRTTDGGTTFGKISLPVEQVTKLPASAEAYGFTLQDYDYMNMPQKEGDVLTMLVTTQAGESEGIVFQSQDGGETWEYMEK